MKLSISIALVLLCALTFAVADSGERNRTSPQRDTAKPSSEEVTTPETQRTDKSTDEAKETPKLIKSIDVASTMRPAVTATAKPTEPKAKPEGHTDSKPEPSAASTINFILPMLTIMVLGLQIVL